MLDSNDEELKSIAWNSFIDYAYDQKFLLFKEMEEARNSFFDQIGEDCCTNHTKMLESERLYIKPNNKEDGRSIYEYVNKYDKDEYLFARLAEPFLVHMGRAEEQIREILKIDQNCHFCE